MLNYETLLSSYDDKLTLLQWLKKVEAALKDASAVSFKVNKKGDATLTFSIVFDDGSEIESNKIVLQQGESVASAAIVNGHLILTLTNGDELDAGNMFDGNVNITGTLDVGGNTNINGNVTAGNVIGSKLQSTGDITASGSITGGEIVENMTGYVFNKGTNYNWTPTYVGVCKNGNKLTFAVFGAFTYDQNAAGNDSLCAFIIPTSVGAKLVPYTISGFDNMLHEMVTPFFRTRYLYNTAIMEITKFSNTQIILRLRADSGNFTDGETYLFRAEFTFLLSDNMAA